MNIRAGVTGKVEALVGQIRALVVQLVNVDRIGTIRARRDIGDLVATSIHTIGSNAWATVDGHAITVHRSVTVGQAIIVDGGITGFNRTVITQIQVVCQAQFDVIAIMGNGQVLVGRSEVNGAARCHVAGPFRITIGADVPALVGDIADIGQLVDVNRIRAIGTSGHIGDFLATGIHPVCGDTRATGDGQTIPVHGGVAVGEATIVDRGIARGDAAVIAQIDVLVQLDVQGIVAIRDYTDVAISQVVGIFGIAFHVDSLAQITMNIRAGVTGKVEALVGQIRALVVQLVNVDRIGTIRARRDIGDLVATSIHTIGSNAWATVDGDTITVHRSVTVGQSIIVDGGITGFNRTVITQIQVVCQSQFDVIAIVGNGQVLVGRSEVNGAARCYITGIG
ncbi:hypothetical protein LMG33818_001671 [Halomonadaceae bacterium LMG 33818]